MGRLPAYLDGDGLLRYFPSEWLQGDDTLTAYALAIADEAGWAVRNLQRPHVGRTAAFRAGPYRAGLALPTADLTIRKLAAIEVLSRYGMAEPSMLDSITVEPNLWRHRRCSTDRDSSSRRGD